MKQKVKREKLGERISRPYVPTKTTGIDDDDEATLTSVFLTGDSSIIDKNKLT